MSSTVGMDTIARLKEIDQALADKDFLFEITMQLFEQSPDATVVIETLTGRILMVNRQMELMFDYHRAELIGQMVEILIPDAFKESHVGHRKAYADDPRVRPMGIGVKLTGRTKLNREIDIEINLGPIVTKNGPCTIATIRRIR